MSPKQSLNVTNSFVDYKIVHTNFFAFPTIVRCDGKPGNLLSWSCYQVNQPFKPERH